MNISPDDMIEHMLDEVESKGIHPVLISSRIRKDKAKRFVNAVFEYIGSKSRMECDHRYYVYIDSDSPFQKQRDEVIYALIEEFHESLVHNLTACAVVKYGESYAQVVHDAYDNQEVQVEIQRGGVNLCKLMASIQAYITNSNNSYLCAMSELRNICKEYNEKLANAPISQEIMDANTVEIENCIRPYVEESATFFNDIMDVIKENFTVDDATVSDRLRNDLSCLCIVSACNTIDNNEIQPEILNEEESRRYYISLLSARLDFLGIDVHLYSQKDADVVKYVYIPILEYVYPGKTGEVTAAIYVSNEELSDEEVLKEASRVLDAMGIAKTSIEVAYVITRGEKENNIFKRLEAAVIECFGIIDNLLNQNFDRIWKSANDKQDLEAVEFLNNLDNEMEEHHEKLKSDIANILDLTEEEVRNIPGLVFFKLVQ